MYAAWSDEDTETPRITQRASYVYLSRDGSEGKLPDAVGRRLRAEARENSRRD